MSNQRIFSKQQKEVITNQDIIAVTITPEMKERIIANCQARGGNLNSRTILQDGEANEGGFAGEEIVKAYLPFIQPAPKTNKQYFNYDFFLPNGKKLDVKSKGNNRFRPTTNFDCTIPLSQKEQKTDFYIFTRVSPDLDVGWICGIISKKKFYDVAQIRKKGENYNNAGRKTIQSVYVCSIGDLSPINIIKDYYESENRDTA
jgi:hypothetical protein